MSDKIEVGSWDRLPHYAVVGTPTKFYVWINFNGKTFSDPEQGESEWVKGAGAFENYAKLKTAADKGRKREFIALVTELHSSNRKQE